MALRALSGDSNFEAVFIWLINKAISTIRILLNDSDEFVLIRAIAQFCRRVRRVPLRRKGRHKIAQGGWLNLGMISCY